ncbi:MAG: tetratricopeptide repeat protein, partial [Bacteroidales bacterium]
RARPIYNNIALFYKQISRYDSAKIYYWKAIKINKDNTEIAKILDNLGILYNEISQYDSAINYLNSAMEIHKVTGNKKGEAFSLNYIGNVYNKMNEYERALQYYERSLSIRQELNLTAEIASSYDNIGNILKKVNQYDKALSYFNKALAIYKNLNDKKMQAYTLNNIGNFYLQLKIYDKALEYYIMSLELRKELKNNNDIAGSYHNIGILYRDIDNFNKALENFEKALELRQTTGNREGVAITLNSIGGLYWNKKNYKTAIKYYNKALEIRKEIKDNIQIAATYTNLGIIYKDLDQTEEAINYYDKAFSIYDSVQDIRGQANIYNLKGNLYKKIGENNKAIEYYKKSISLYKRMGADYNEALIAHNIGDMYALKKDFKNTQTYYTIAVNLATKVKNKELLKEVYKKLAQLYENNNNIPQSYAAFKLYTAYNDSVINDMNKKRIAEIEFETTIKKKDAEIQKEHLRYIEKEAINKQLKIYIFAVIFILAIIIIFSIIIFSQYKHKLKINKLLEEKNSLIEIKNEELALKNKQITDSIFYAKRIQEAILPSNEQFKKIFPESFILYRPKEIVSGDFYWLTEVKDLIFVAAVDCTGHGVPGAFMSMIGYSLLNEIVIENKVTDPAQILDQLDYRIMKSLKQDSDRHKRQEDGMELTICVIDKKAKTITVSLANHKMFLYKQGKLETILGDIYSIGGMYEIKQRKNAHFTSKIIPIQDDMTLYMFSDGYIDQFGGGELNERYKTSRFEQLLSEIQSIEMEEQYKILQARFDEWKGSYKQLDDVLIIGIKF